MDALPWPRKCDLFGVGVSATTYDQAEEVIIRAARQRIPAVVTHLPVHGIVTAATDQRYRKRVNCFDIVAPDGQPVRWALNRFYGTALDDRCYGPELMLRLCRRAAREGIGVYLYGSTLPVVGKLKRNLQEWCPGLRIVGHESPPFRPLTEQEDRDMIDRVNGSGAGLMFIGLGCPKQDNFAFAHRGRIRAVQLCVGAAFDFHAGAKKMAPGWMQKAGLEWLFRLCQEPGRLLHRYHRTNTLFVGLVARRLIFGR
jgi:exopolysaccharide biosynthesis WecB/TagA/CpsF family protein